MKKLISLVFLFLAGLVFAEGPKHVFLFIGDGMSLPQRMLAEKEGPLAMNTLPFQAPTRTSSASDYVTDSAAAATAIACGVKTRNGSVGLDPEGKRLVSCAELAKKAGKKVGILTTVPITHATPAGFYAHRESRKMTKEIEADRLASGFDFFAGHAEASLKNPGPALADLVRKALAALEGPEGFFLMAEGGLIDWAGHANDTEALIRETRAFDDAVKVALEFLEKHPDDTLVIVTGDHETGGLTLEGKWTTKNHTALPVITSAQGAGAERFSGFIDNTDIGNYIKSFYETGDAK